MFQILKWELKKNYYSTRWILGLCVVTLTILYLLSLNDGISEVVSSVYSSVLFAINIAISLAGGFFLFVFPIWNVIGGFQKPLYLLEKARGISYPKVLFIKIIVNLISIGVGISLLLSGTNLVHRFGSISVELMTFNIEGGIYTNIITLYFIAVFFPILGVFIFLLLSSIGGFKKTKGISICVVILIFITLSKLNSWFLQNIWLLHLAAFLVVTCASIYLAESKYE